MANRSLSKDDASVEVWNRTCQVLRRELGEATFGSWLGQASLREQDGGVCLVAATGVARVGHTKRAELKEGGRGHKEEVSGKESQGT